VRQIMFIMRLCFCGVVFSWLPSCLGAVVPKLQVALSTQGASFYKLPFLFHDIIQSYSRIGEYLVQWSIFVVVTRNSVEQENTSIPSSDRISNACFYTQDK
jgi:hypothetical protein